MNGPVSASLMSIRIAADLLVSARFSDGRIARISVRSLASTSGGVLAGAKIPIHESMSKPFTPASAMVGTSGVCGLRRGPGDRNRAHVAGLDVRQRGRIRIDEEVDAAGEDVRIGELRALVGNFEKFRAGRVHQRGGDQMLAGADTGIRHRELAGFLASRPSALRPTSRRAGPCGRPARRKCRTPA